MDLKAELLKEHSKTQTLFIVKYIGSNKDRFAALMDLFMEGEYRVTQRAAWVFRYAVEAHPKLIKPHLNRLINNLSSSVHDAVKRNTLKILENIDLPEEHLGVVANLCFDFLANPREAIAIRAFSMEVLYKICLKEPGLANELKILIEDEYPHASAGFKAKARKVLKGIAKLVDRN